ncbi:MAG: hypothetical protein M5U26_27005 [Planctomycetota bacterium]|nr:hypothetical protein [Planctomycetota bacterium]
MTGSGGRSKDAVEEVRRVRTAISAEFGHDLKAYVEYLRESQKNRRKAKPAKRRAASKVAEARAPYARRKRKRAT